MNESKLFEKCVKYHSSPISAFKEDIMNEDEINCFKIFISEFFSVLDNFHPSILRLYTLKHIVYNVYIHFRNNISIKNQF